MLSADRFRSSDRKNYESLWHEYEGKRIRTEDRSVVCESNWTAILADDARLNAFALRNQESGEPVGFIHYVFHFCTKSPRRECYINDLYVDETFRGKGGGRKLIDALVEECGNNDIFRLTWIAEEDNRRAQKLYDSYCEGRLWMRYKLAIQT